MFKTQYRSDLLRYIGAGLELALTFGLFLAAGMLLDRRLGTFPAFTLTGMVLGFAGGLYRLARQGREMTRLDEEQQPGPPREQ